MPTEIVLLSDVEPTEQLMAGAVGQLHPEGTYISFRGGRIRQFVDGDGEALLAVFGTRPVNQAREAAAAITDPPTSFGLWTDMTIPLNAAERGREVAEVIAAAVGGVVADRA